MFFMLNFVCNKENIMKKIFWLCLSVVSFMNLIACTGTIVDSRDNQEYKIVTIGRQTWMAQNLNYRYEPEAKGDTSSFCYNNIADSCSKYGRLYLRNAAMDMSGRIPGNKPLDCDGVGSCKVSGNVRGVCPEGWHLPSKAEWDTLITVAGGPKMAANVLKAPSDWLYNGKGTCGYGSNLSLFTALPAGIGFVHHWDDPPYGSVKSLAASTALGETTFFWSSTELEDRRAYFMSLSSCDDDSTFTSSDMLGRMQQMAFMFEVAFSVRCVKD